MFFIKILFVIDQFDSANNGTTISAKRFVKGLQDRGHEVFIVSTGSVSPNKYIVRTLPLPIVVSHIVRSQGMCFGIPSKKIFRKALSQVDLVHFYTPFGLSVHGLKIAEEMKVPHTTAFHVQPENITYTIGLRNKYKSK